MEGLDAAHKLGLLSSLAFGTTLPPDDFYVEGISAIKKIDFKYAKEMGYTVKHLAVCKKNENKIELRAHPVLIQKNSWCNSVVSQRDIFLKVQLHENNVPPKKKYYVCSGECFLELKKQLVGYESSLPLPVLN